MFEQLRFRLKSKNLALKICRSARMAGVITMLLFISGLITCIMELTVEHMLWTLWVVPLIAVLWIYEVPSPAILLRVEPLFHLFNYNLRGAVYLIVAAPFFVRMPVIWIWLAVRADSIVTFFITAFDDFISFWYGPAALMLTITALMYIAAGLRREDGDDMPHYFRVQRGY